MSTKKILLGAHVSILGGIEQALMRSEEIGATAMQIFTRSSRTWETSLYDEQEIEVFKKKRAESPIVSVISHAPYLINLGSSSEETRQKSCEALLKEIIRADSIGIDAIVLHPGAYKEGTLEGGIELIAHNLSNVLAQAPGSVPIALETMAKQGSAIGSRFEELRTIYDACTHKERIRFCLDLCHVHVAGYPMTTVEGFNATLAEFDAILGLDKLAVIHCNDSVYPCGAQKDRHARIGEGTLTRDTYYVLMNDPRLSGITKILETPTQETHQEHASEIAYLKSLIDK